MWITSLLYSTCGSAYVWENNLSFWIMATGAVAMETGVFLFCLWLFLMSDDFYSVFSYHWHLSAFSHNTKSEFLRLIEECLSNGQNWIIQYYFPAFTSLWIQNPHYGKSVHNEFETLWGERRAWAGFTIQSYPFTVFKEFISFLCSSKYKPVST
jgi:hypothetical protein